MRFVILSTTIAAAYEAFVIRRVYRMVRRNYTTKPIGCYQRLGL